MYVCGDKLDKLKPLKIQILNLDQLNIAERKLNEYSKQIEEIINRPYNQRKYNCFIIFRIIIIIYIFLK